VLLVASLAVVNYNIGKYAHAGKYGKNTSLFRLIVYRPTVTRSYVAFPPRKSLEEIYENDPSKIEIARSENRLKIAFVDTGIDYNEPFIAYKVSQNLNGDGDPLPYDDEGHGTIVAGVATEDLDQVEILSVKDKSDLVVGPFYFLSRRDKIIKDLGKETDLWNSGIRSAYKKGARLFNICQGIGPASSLDFRLRGFFARKSYRELIERLEEKFGAILEECPDALFIAASGNSREDTDRFPNFPSALSSKYSNIVAVAAVDERDELSEFSNYGVETVQLAAPGERILVRKKGGKLDLSSGTSLAAPMVTRACAKALLINRGLSVSSLKEILIRSAEKKPGLSDILQWGGVLDEERVVEMAEQTRQNIQADRGFRRASWTGARAEAFSSGNIVEIIGHINGVERRHLAPGDLKFVEKLLNDRADVDALHSKWSLTPLMFAALRGDLALVQILLQYQANPKVEHSSGTTVLQFARQSGDSRVVLKIREALKAIAFSSGNVVEIVAHINDIERRHATLDELEFIEKLLKDGATVDEIHPKWTSTPLMFAAQRGDFPLVQLLLRYQADPKAQNSRGTTVLQFAEQSKNSAIIQVLLSKSR
jgi:hypothetical protein